MSMTKGWQTRKVHKHWVYKNTNVALIVGDKCKWQQNVNFEEGPLLGMALKHHSRA